jgi:beta-galactosidase GanA
MRDGALVFGTQYYRPPFPTRDAWSSDLDLIVNSGMNTVKIWAVWSWIERSNGAYYFDDLDELVELCSSKRLQTVINIVPEGAPYWLERLHPDARYQAENGMALEFSGAANLPSGGWPGLCRDKPAVEVLANRFLAVVARRYATHAGLIAFDVWNEPHIDPAFDYPNNIFCYCEHSLQKFLRWLRLRYSSLEALNRVWHRAYATWDDVKAPTRFGTYADMIDWRLFWLENHAGWLESRVKAVKEAAPTKIAMTHVPFSGYLGGTGKGGLGQTLADEFLLAPKVEKFGLTSFPKWLMGNDFVQHLMNVELVAAAAAGKEFWQSELQSGGGLWGAFGSTVATPEEIRLWNWGALAGGAKGILYWQWKPEPSGLEAPGFGLTTISGEPSVRTEAAREIAMRARSQSAIAGATLLLPLNGIYVSRHSAIFSFAANRADSLYADALHGAYRRFFDDRIPVRFVHGDRLEHAFAEGLRMLVVPAALSLSPQEEEELMHFTSNGGTLVLEACAGLFDQAGLLRPHSKLLRELAGLKQIEVDRCDSLEIAWNDLQYRGAKFFGGLQRQYVSVCEDDVDILATFSDGEPAVCKRRIGQGAVAWIGTYCSLSQQKVKIYSPLTRWACQQGYAAITRLSAPEGALVRLHRSANDQVLAIAVNYNHQPIEVSVVGCGSEECNATATTTVVVPARDGTSFLL